MLHIKKHEVYWIKNQRQRGTNIKVIKGYIQCTQLYSAKSQSLNVNDGSTEMLEGSWISKCLN